jgi:hypothetical protein
MDVATLVSLLWDVSMVKVLCFGLMVQSTLDVSGMTVSPCTVHTFALHKYFDVDRCSSYCGSVPASHSVHL